MVVSNPLGPMKSPDAIHLILRSVSGLSPRRNAVEFDKLSKRIYEEANGLIVVFVDDFIGSGRQFETQMLNRILSNNELCQTLKAKREAPVNFFMLVCVAYREGLRRSIEALQAAPTWLKMTILAGDVLGPESKTFDSKSEIFPHAAIRSQAEEIVVQRIGRRLYPDAPQGWGNMQSLVVFEHNTPNNTLPVIWKDGYVGKQLWKAIFPRMGAG